MKSFYTSVNRYGNSILYRGYNENGAAIAQRYKFSPTLYTPSKKPTKFKGFDSGYVAPLSFPTMRDAKEWLEQYEEMEGVNIFGTRNYIHQFITEKFPGEIDFEPNAITVVNFDIEVASDS